MTQISTLLLVPILLMMTNADEGKARERRRLRRRPHSVHIPTYSIDEVLAEEFAVRTLHSQDFSMVHSPEPTTPSGSNDTPSQHPTGVWANGSKDLSSHEAAAAATTTTTTSALANAALSHHGHGVE